MALGCATLLPNPCFLPLFTSLLTPFTPGIHLLSPPLKHHGVRPVASSRYIRGTSRLGRRKTHDGHQDLGSSVHPFDKPSSPFRVFNTADIDFRSHYISAMLYMR
jgi:hypothetical protein